MQPMAYHKVAESLMIVGYEVDEPIKFDWMTSKRYGQPSFPDKKLIKKLLPYAKIPRSITKRIHELSLMCGIQYLINPVIALADISHAPRV